MKKARGWGKGEVSNTWSTEDFQAPFLQHFCPSEITLHLVVLSAQIWHITFTHPRRAQKNTFMKYLHKEGTHSLTDSHSGKYTRHKFQNAK